jgi:predicted short-subunit dehydrogenase-like oxidoreductase (DUF2520 family)
MNMQVINHFLISDQIRSVVIIGAGNVAWHLGKALQKKKINILQVAGRTIESTRELAGALKTNSTLDFKSINPDADLYIIAVSDDSIDETIKNLNLSEQLVVHTAGSIPLSVFEKQYINYGVFYPLQTLTKTRNIHFEDVPVCIEANTQENADKLLHLAGLISQKTLLIDSEKRATLHLAAVFACNFVNHMYSIADQIIKKQKIDFTLLHPLIIETSLKMLEMKPTEAQTGPALRNNTRVMQKHLEMLKKYPEIEEIYHVLSNNIRNIKLTVDKFAE